MISIPRDFLIQIDAAAEAAYPRECCGLFAGTEEDKGNVRVTRMRTSRNMADASRPDRFEIDPEVRFALMRDIGEFDRLDQNSAEPQLEHIVGHYHSHPDHPARPSGFDLEMAFESEFFWLIVSVTNGQAAEKTIHRLDDDGQTFHEVAFTAC